MNPTLTRYTSKVRASTLTLFTQAFTVLAVAGVVLWTLLFTEYPPVHDALHSLRHALYIIPCH